MTEVQQKLTEAEKKVRKSIPKTGAFVNPGLTDWVPPQFGKNYGKFKIPPFVHKKLIFKQLGIPDSQIHYYNSLSEDDMKYVERSHAIRELITFDAWFLALFPDMYKHPTKLDFCRKIYPGFFERRELYMKKVLQLQRDYLHLLARGCTTKQDMITIFTINRHPELKALLTTPVGLPTEIKEDFEEHDWNETYHTSIFRKTINYVFGTKSEADRFWSVVYEGSGDYAGVFDESDMLDYLETNYKKVATKFDTNSTMAKIMPLMGDLGEFLIDSVEFQKKQ